MAKTITPSLGRHFLNNSNLHPAGGKIGSRNSSLFIPPIPLPSSHLSRHGHLGLHVLRLGQNGSIPALPALDSQRQNISDNDFLTPSHHMSSYRNQCSLTLTLPIRYPDDSPEALVPSPIPVGNLSIYCDGWSDKPLPSTHCAQKGKLHARHNGRY